MATRIEKRLEQLESAFPMWRAPTEEETRARVVEEGLKRLTMPELCLLKEVFRLRAENPEKAPVEFLNMLTDPQRAMQDEWSRITRQIARGGDVDAKREEEIAKRNEPGPYAVQKPN